MAKRKSTKESADKQKWNKVFNALVHMLRSQQTQLESLAKERTILEDRIKFQYERWVSDVNLFKDQISQMKRDFTAQEMERMVEAAKSDLFIGLKQREAFTYKKKLENADGDLADFREWFDYLSCKLSDHKGTSKIGDNEGEEHQVNALRSELRRLKCENTKLTSEKNSEVSALLAEKKFVWNQYNKMESNLKQQLQNKSAKVELANKKIETLLSNMEELQSSNTKKDDALVRLKSDLAKLESESIKKNEEISKLSRELEQLKKSRTDSVTPVLRRCTSARNKNTSVGMKVVTVKKESDISQHHEKGCRNSKRKALEPITISDTPKLFTSSFKVPKLKSASPRVH